MTGNKRQKWWKMGGNYTIKNINSMQYNIKNFYSNQFHHCFTVDRMNERNWFKTRAVSPVWNISGNNNNAF